MLLSQNDSKESKARTNIGLDFATKNIENGSNNIKPFIKWNSEFSNVLYMDSLLINLWMVFESL